MCSSKGWGEQSGHFPAGQGRAPGQLPVYLTPGCPCRGSGRLCWASGALLGGGTGWGKAGGMCPNPGLVTGLADPSLCPQGMAWNKYTHSECLVCTGNLQA